MRSIQKFFILLLVVSMLLSLAACSKAEKLVDAVTAKDFSLGTVSGNHYENDFVGVQCDLADSWTIHGEDKLAELSGLVANSFSGEEAKKLVEENNSVFLFYAEEAETFHSINIVVTNTESYSLAMLEHKEFVDQMVAQMPALLAQSYMEDITCQAETFSFCGEEVYGIGISATANGIPIYERQVVILEGTYSITLTACTYFEDTTADLLGFFSAFEGQ